MDDLYAEKDEVVNDDAWVDRWIQWVNHAGPHLAKCRVIDVEPVAVTEEVA